MPFVDQAEVANSACHWGSVRNADGDIVETQYDRLIASFA
jgi:hypothetical protein